MLTTDEKNTLQVQIRQTINSIKSTKRFGGATSEFLTLFIALVIGLSLVGTLNSFASTASVSAFPTSANTATLYGLIPLFLAVVFIAIVAGVAYREVQKFSSARRQFTEMGYNPINGTWQSLSAKVSAIVPTRYIQVN